MKPENSIIMSFIMKHTLSIVLYSCMYVIYIIFPFHISWAIIVFLLCIVISLIYVESSDISDTHTRKIISVFFVILFTVSMLYQFNSYEPYYEEIRIDKNQEYTYETTREQANINIIDGHKIKYIITTSLQDLPDMLKNKTLDVKISKENSKWSHDPDIKRSIL